MTPNSLWELAGYYATNMPSLTQGEAYIILQNLNRDHGPFQTLAEYASAWTKVGPDVVPPPDGL